MYALHVTDRRRRRRRARPAVEPFPWEIGHAAPEDRALGLELELIELVRRRELLGHRPSSEARMVDAEIDRVRAALGELHPPESLSA